MADDITPEKVRALLAAAVTPYTPGRAALAGSALEIARAYLVQAAEIERLRAALHEALDGWLLAVAGISGDPGARGAELRALAGPRE